jgi:DNA invertase Pin-like site-specific DNA recombinase
MGEKIGYARVSSDEQDLSLQKDELKALGCTHIFSDKISGAKKERKGLSKCLNTLKKGDTLVVWRLDRLGRSMPHLVSDITELKERGIHFKSIHDGVIDTTTASGDLVFNIFAALAQFERELIRERTSAGLKAARSRGRMGGRRPVLPNDHRVKMAKKLHADKNLSIDEICVTLKISKSTLYRYLSL